MLKRFASAIRMLAKWEVHDLFNNILGQVGTQGWVLVVQMQPPFGANYFKIMQFCIWNWINP